MHAAAMMATRLALSAILILPALACGAATPIGAPPAEAAASTPSPSAALKLHVPSPDWRDQIIYFLMIDRFDDGDPGNNDQGAGEFDPASNAKYSGGDLKGIARRLDYIRGLGATALWLTPPVANQWWNGSYGGYHGYWAENFMAVDAHYGTLDDYRHLSHALHAAGMYLVQDVVVNHTGDFFAYNGGWDPDDPVQYYTPNTDSVPVRAPTQWPFSRNDARDPKQRAAAIYHWTPDIADFTDYAQETSYQLSGLDDLNTENPVVRAALRESYGYWIREVGVDAFRVDTAFHVPPEFFRDFLYADDAERPGMMRVAKQTGRDDFLAFGEGFGVDKPFADAQARKLERYMRAPDGAPRLPGMINFPLYGSTLDVFARGRPTAELGHRIRSTMQVHAQPHRMPSFVDNHDVDRFLAGGGQAGLKQSLLLIMTLPGIPTIYYGTEQGFREQRAAMFTGGFGSGGRDHFDREAPLYHFLQRAIALRRDNKLFSRGTPTVLAENSATAGALAYRMDHAGETALVVLNSADTPALLAHLDTGLPAGTRLAPLFAIDGTQDEHVVDAAGRLTLKLPARSGLVWKAAGTSTVQAPTTAARLELATLESPSPDGRGAGVKGRAERNAAASPAPHPPSGHLTPARAHSARALRGARASGSQARPFAPEGEGKSNTPTFEGDIEAAGTATGIPRFQLVIDGDLAHAPTVVPDPDGRWRATLDTASMIDPTITHSLVAWSEAPAAISESHRFRVERQWTPLADVADPTGDDHGPIGRYVYPTDASWGEHRPLDLRRVRVAASGGSLKIDLQLRELVATWNPPNGFDHLALTLFIELPDRAGGATVMPLQNATLPAGMRWHYRLRAGGWSNALFAADGATGDHEGTPVSPAADLHVDRANHTLSFTLPAAALGRPASLSGAKLYLTTWDYDGRYRSLSPQPQAHGFGGGDGARDALIMDDTAVIALPL